MKIKKQSKDLMESCLFNITECLTLFLTILTWFYFSSDADSKENLTEEQVVPSTTKSVNLAHQAGSYRVRRREIAPSLAAL